MSAPNAKYVDDWKNDAGERVYGFESNTPDVATALKESYRVYAKELYARRAIKAEVYPSPKSTPANEWWIVEITEFQPAKVSV